LFEVLGDCAGRDLAEFGDCIESALLPDGGAADDVALIAIRPYSEGHPQPAHAGPTVLP